MLAKGSSQLKTEPEAVAKLRGAIGRRGLALRRHVLNAGRYMVQELAIDLAFYAVLAGSRKPKQGKMVTDIASPPVASDAGYLCRGNPDVVTPQH